MAADFRDSSTLRNLPRSPARVVIAALITAASTTSAAADNSLCDLAVVERAAVALVIDGATFDLLDGRQVRLAGVLAPRAGEPYAAQATEHLSVLVADKTVGLALDEQATDRHGRLLVHAFVGDDWVQHAMITAGTARVHTRAEVARCAKPLLTEEATARAAKRGLWALPHYRVRNPGELDDEVGTFQIVEGKVLSVAASKGRVFVNFGADYRTDFTVTVAARDAKRLAKDGIDPRSWAGKQIRVRGWLSRLNGPEVELTHQAQIQIIE